MANTQSTAETHNQSAENGDFQIENLHKFFANCYGTNGENLDMDSYINAFDEVFKFLNLLGTVFGWVASDVQAKTNSLRSHRSGSSAENYVTIQSMVDYEIRENLIKHKAKDSPTASRNLLRLHRALEYITQFLEVLPGLQDTEKCCPCSQAAYKKTLAKHHPWLVQKGALMAMNMLPTKEGLIQKFCEPGEEGYNKAARTLDAAVKVMTNVYTKTQEIYAKNNILDLP